MYEEWARFQVRPVSEEMPRIGSKCNDLKSSPVRIGEFGMTFQTSEACEQS